MSGCRAREKVTGSENTHSKGREGEDRAARELEQRGITIIERNFRATGGEIDLIGVEGETLVFIEVKNWKNLPIESLEQSINKKKQRRIIETAKYFIKNNREYKGMRIRFDIAFIGPDGLKHLPAAWTENIR
jgi:putative endonuclease